jgi:ATP synthase protein I
MSLTPDELGRKIKEAQSRQQPETYGLKKTASPESRKAYKAATDFVAALVVGVFLGYWIDRWLHTTPFGIIIFLFLGFGAGFMNLYRSQMGPKKDTRNDQDKKG